MGWSWSPWIAQKTLEFLLESGPTGRLHHGDPAVDLEKETPGAHWAYLDDYGRIFWRADREAAEEAAGGYQQRVATMLRGKGSGVHKEQRGGGIRSFGWLVAGGGPGDFACVGKISGFDFRVALPYQKETG